MADENAALTKVRQALHEGDRDEIAGLVRCALDEGLEVAEVLEAIKGGLDEVGQKYQSGEYFLPELILGGTAAKVAIDELLPHMTPAEESSSFVGKVVLGTVEGDIHDLGKTIVFVMLSGAGFKVYDIGVDAPASKFVDKAREVEADIIAASALLTTTVPRLKDIETGLLEAGIRARVKTMVGGAAVSSQYADSIGADGYGRDGYEAVQVANSLMGS